MLFFVNAHARKKATRTDVARLAGVSESTVSYALSGVRSIADETKERVLAAAAELGYTPNVMAQGLAGKKSGLLALMFPVSDRGFNPSDYEYIAGASKVAEDAGYQLLMWPNPIDDLESLRRIATQHLVDGVILMEVRGQDARPEILREANIPYVLIGRTDDESENTWVDADFSLWGPMAIDLLANQGHTEVAFLTQPEQFYNTGYGPLVRTERDLLARAKERHIAVHIRRSASSIAAGREGFEQMRERRPNVTAVLGMNELAMIGVLEAMIAVGAETPRDYSVLQFGLSPASAEMTSLHQDTISVEGTELGAKAAEFLLKRMAGDRTTPLTFLSPPVYVSRGSVGPAR